MARSGRFELPTPRFVVWCSIQLSYERVIHKGHCPVTGARTIGEAPVAGKFFCRIPVLQTLPQNRLVFAGPVARVCPTLNSIR